MTLLLTVTVLLEIPLLTGLPYRFPWSGRLQTFLFSWIAATLVRPMQSLGSSKSEDARK